MYVAYNDVYWNICMYFYHHIFEHLLNSLK